MRRGLKCKKCRRPPAVCRGHTEFPDEEGTEIQAARQSCKGFRSHTEFPDEEGTEIRDRHPISLRNVLVTPNSPMRRGLKFGVAAQRESLRPAVTPNSPMRRGLKSDQITIGFVHGFHRHTEFPDEEGTEMVRVHKHTRLVYDSHTEFPDEEGTEMDCATPVHAAGFQCHTEFPDEEGTEIMRPPKAAAMLA